MIGKFGVAVVKLEVLDVENVYTGHEVLDHFVAAALLEHLLIGALAADQQVIAPTAIGG
ncbi:MAG: hypothetical protein KL863_25990 [Rhizobium sp.]|nr:hypothetical protein [Rhizobium sp.]MBX9459215.1 hypothetical protein [Rhizobium sp.]